MAGNTVARPLSVAMMCESDALGGAEMVILRLAEALRARGHRVVGVGPDERTQPDRGSNGWLRSKFGDAGFEWHTYRKRRGVDPLCVAQLTDILSAARVDVVHSHEFAMAVYGTAATRLAGIPHVISMHGNEDVATNWKARLALRWAFARSRASVVVSDGTRLHMEEALGLPPGRVEVIPNGVPERAGDRDAGRRAAGAVEGDLLVVAVGSLIPRKNHELLIRALAALGTGSDAPRWKLAIAGTGVEHARLVEVIGSLGVADRVRLLGPRDDIPDLLSAADVFAMPSNWEGLPMALLEAMFAGRAVVASAVAGIPEAITAEVHGLLVPPADVAALSAALRRLLSDEELRRRLGAAARARALGEFSLDAMTSAYERHYVAGN